MRTGSPGWLATWPAPQRRRVVELGARRRGQAMAWLGAALVGIAVAGAATAGHPAERDLPTAGWALAALVIDSMALLLCADGWRRTVRVFAEQAPPPASLAGTRIGTAVPGMVALLVSLVATVFTAILPIVALSRGTFGWTEAAYLVAAAFSLCCGLAPLRLWVNLLPIQQSALSEGVSE